MRLLGSVFNDGGSARLDRRKHNVHRRTDRNHIEIDRTAGELWRHHLNHPVLHRGNAGAERCKALEMLIDRPYTEVAAARHRYPRCAKTAKQRADEIVRSPHMPRQIMRHHMCSNGSRINIDRVPVDRMNLCAKAGQYIQRGCHIGNVGDIFYAADTIRQNDSGQNRNRCVFGPADFHVTGQAIAAPYDIFFQVVVPLPKLNAPASRSWFPAYRPAGSTKSAEGLLLCPQGVLLTLNKAS